MKINKILLGLLVILTVVLFPRVSVSNNTDASQTIVLSKTNLLVLDSEVNGESTSTIIAKAKQLDSALNNNIKAKLTGNNKPLYLFINSPGGSIQSSLE